jgi:hypothetical protein
MKDRKREEERRLEILEEEEMGIPEQRPRWIREELDEVNFAINGLERLHLSILKATNTKPIFKVKEGGTERIFPVDRDPLTLAGLEAELFSYRQRIEIIKQNLGEMRFRDISKLKGVL